MSCHGREAAGHKEKSMPPTVVLQADFVISLGVASSTQNV
jgi:hypothetical protein